MRLRRENIDLPEDQGCLQWVLGVPLGLIYAFAVYCCYLAWTSWPSPRDDPLRSDMQYLAYFSITLCAIGLLLTLTPVFRRTMGKWWYILPLLLAGIAYVRSITL
ncbi:hypothetical protein [Streptomyces sp. NPDC059874]|uniref:hypothetical protein n=1 Tax=Streptomyces sp. NPDC059874 TaxID=3346983 RepID=UPI0036696379